MKDIEEQAELYAKFILDAKKLPKKENDKLFQDMLMFDRCGINYDSNGNPSYYDIYEDKDQILSKVRNEEEWR